MNDFAQCIEYLLLNHDCVVVPGFGAFIAQHQEARVDTKEEVALPPYRIVRFNAELQQEDSFITDSIQQIYGIEEYDAKEKLGRWVTELLQTLEDEGSVDFGCIGTFTDDDDNTLTFSPSESGIVTPNYYGLDAFHIAEVPQLEEAPTPIIETTDKHVTIRINRNFANYVAAACIAVLLFFTFSTPAGNTDTLLYSEQQSAELFMPTNLLPRTDVKKEVKAEPKKVVEKQVSTQEITKEETAKNIESKHPEAKYCLVLASAVSQKNGKAYVEILKSRGFDTARTLDNGKVLRVVVGEYQTEDEARTAAKEIHRQSEEYSNAWVYAL